MVFHGLQKLTLLDYPGKLACTVFTSGCNFRCPYCQNSELALGKPFETFQEEEIIAFLKKRKGVLDGMCVSGGEPLLHDLAPFLTRVKALGYAVKLDTNGSFPERLESLVASGLVDYVAMDIKSSRAGYVRAAGFDRLDPVDRSVRFLLSDAVDYEFRTTVVRELHGEKEFDDIADWIAGAKRYYLQGYVDSEYVLEPGLSAYSREELEAFRARLATKLRHVEIRGVN